MNLKDILIQVLIGVLVMAVWQGFLEETLFGKKKKEPTPATTR